MKLRGQRQTDMVRPLSGMQIVAVALLFFTSLFWGAASSARAPKEGWAIVLDGGVAESCVVAGEVAGSLSSQCGQGKRKTKVVCLKQWREVPPVAEDGSINCEEAEKPQDPIFEDCNVHCVVVGNGSSSWLERLNLPLDSAEARDTVQDCVSLAANYTDVTQNSITRCLLSPGRYTEANIDLAGKQDLVIEPLDVSSHNASWTAEETAVVFDGTDVLYYEHDSDYHLVWSETEEKNRQEASAEKRRFFEETGLGGLISSTYFRSGGVYYLSLTTVEQHEENARMQYNLSKIENFIVDGIGIQRAPDYNTARQPCFEYDARKGDDAIPRPFSCEYAEEFFVSAEDWRNTVWGKTLHFYYDPTVNWTHPAKFWLDRLNQRLYVLTTQHSEMQKDSKYDNLRVGHLKPKVRVKVPGRATSFVISSSEGTSSKRLEIKGLHFLGSSVSLRGPKSKKLHSQIAIKGCRFLFSTPKSIEVETTTKRSRGGAEPIQLSDNTLEFGEGAIWYVSSGAKVQRNLLVGNAFSDRPYYSFHSTSQADTLEDNTCLYEGSTGGHLSFSHSNEARRNLWIGQGFLSKWHDNAVHHAFVGSQTNLVIEESWFLGPSLIKSVRLDTAKSTTQPGRNTIMRKNVFLGLEPLTVKGDEHVFEHNTGDRSTMVEAWASLADQNAATWFRFNAVGHWGTRGSTTTFGPGFSSLNACHDLQVCNPQNTSLPNWLREQFQINGPKKVPSYSNKKYDICSLLINCFPRNATDMVPTYEFDTPGLATHDSVMEWKTENEFENQWKLLRTSENGLSPEGAFTKMLRHRDVLLLDFRPSNDSASGPLGIDCTEAAANGAECSGDGGVLGFASDAQTDGAFPNPSGSGVVMLERYANYLGAYRPTQTKPDPPGCPMAECRRGVFPLPESHFINSKGESSSAFFSFSTSLILVLVLPALVQWIL